MFKKNNEPLKTSVPEKEIMIDMEDSTLFDFQRADDSASEHIAAPKYSYSRIKSQF